MVCQLPAVVSDPAWAVERESVTSLGCARCGRCCTGITLSVDPDTFEPEPGTDAATDLAFIRAHWTRSHTGDGGEQYWSCDQYDEKHCQCRAHQDRPPVCAGFPWYADGPTAARGAYLDGQCSYLRDLPPARRPAGAQPLIPIEAVRR